MALKTLTAISGSSHRSRGLLTPNSTRSTVVGILGKYESPSPESPHTTCMLIRYSDASGSHMSQESEGAHIRVEQGALDPANSGHTHQN